MRRQRGNMKADTGYLDHVISLLAPIGDITSRAMFGGYGIFYRGLMFALISNDTLYFKVDDSNREAYRKAGSKPFPHGISYWEAPPELLEDTAKLHQWAYDSIAIALAKAKKQGK